MTYQRVIPRDLFNEADLLKCYGRLWICLNLRKHDATLGDEPNENDPGDHSGGAFDIVQNPDDGALTIGNVPFCVRGERLHLSRPLNSRDPWPLWVEDMQGEICERVFTDEGELSPEFLDLICTHDWESTGVGALDAVEYRCAACQKLEYRDRS